MCVCVCVDGCICICTLAQFYKLLLLHNLAQHYPIFARFTEVAYKMRLLLNLQQSNLIVLDSFLAHNIITHTHTHTHTHENKTG